MGSDVLVLDREQALLDIVRALLQASIEELLDLPCSSNSAQVLACVLA